VIAGSTSIQTNDDVQISLFEIRDDSVREYIRSLDIRNMTPMQALVALEELQRRVAT
jgi:hypothetical protein